MGRGGLGEGGGGGYIHEYLQIGQQKTFKLIHISEVFTIGFVTYSIIPNTGKGKIGQSFDHLDSICWYE